MVIDEESYSRCSLPICVIYRQVHKERHARGGAAPEFSAYSLRHNYAASLYQHGASPVGDTASDDEHQKTVANKLCFTNRNSDEAKTA